MDKSTDHPILAAEPGLEWDTNLDALKVALAPANAASGSPYWRLIRATYDASARGRSTIYCEVQNEKGERLIGQKITLSWPGGSGSATTENKPAPELAANFGIGGSYDPAQGAGPYTVGVDGLSSDKVSGIGRPKGNDAIFYVTWRKTVSGPGLAKSVIRGMVVGGQAGLAVLLRGAGSQPRQTALDGAGAFVFADLPAGSYTIEVSGVTVPNLRVDGSSSLDVPLIDLRPRQSIIQGAVLKATGEAVSGSKVILTNADTRQEAMTDSKGKYQFASLMAGSYTIEVSGQVKTTTVNGREQVTVDFRLPDETARKPIAQYLLFGSPQQTGTRANLLLAEDYVLKFTPAIGFSVDEALQAATVVIVGDMQAISAADEEKLKANGCQVTRLGGGPYAIEQSFTELVKGKGLSPVPAERLRGPARAARDNEDV